MSDTYEREDISKDTIQFKITIPKEEFNKEYKAILKQELEDTDIKGFRKGKVPGELVEPQVGYTLKIQALEKLIPEYLERVLIKEDVLPIAPPQYKELPNFEKGSDLEFTMNVTVMPEFKMGNLKKLEIKGEDISVSKKEVDEALERLQKNQKTNTKEINEDWAKEIIKLLRLDGVKDLKGLRKYIKDAILSQKEHLMHHQLEDKALEEAIKLSNIEIPQPAIEYEASERERAFVMDMQEKGIDIDQFLKANNITLDKMREMWREDAKQALQTDVFLKLYSEERNIEVTEEDLKKKIELLKKNAPEKTDPSVFKDARWKEYIKRVEIKEKAFHQFLDEVIKIDEKKEKKTGKKESLKGTDNKKSQKKK
jgi:FKBP-type peptidyl-prolyl cis-trans isomerase (trigger factor)